MTRGDFLRRRNALWAELRALPPGTPEFEKKLAQLAELIGWPRDRVLAGLGMTHTEAPGGPSDER